MGTPKRAHHHHHQASSVAAMETIRKNLSVSSSSVWMPPKVVVGQQLSMPSAAASQQQQQQQQHQQQSSSSSSLGGLMKTTPPPFHQSDEEWANIHTVSGGDNASAILNYNWIITSRIENDINNLLIVDYLIIGGADVELHSEYGRKDEKSLGHSSATIVRLQHVIIIGCCCCSVDILAKTPAD